MIVRCTSTQLTAQQSSRLGTTFDSSNAKRLEIGRQYLVLGLQYDVDSILWGTGAWLQIPLSPNELVFLPFYLFEVVDGRPSRHWQTMLWPDGAITMWPDDFYRDYFHGDLEKGDRQAIADYQRALERLVVEAESKQRPRDTFACWPAARR